MLTVGLVGLGSMGGGHFERYVRLMNEGFPVKLVAVCDIDDGKLAGKTAQGNIENAPPARDLSPYHKYKTLDDMLANEKLDYVDIALPTYEHAAASIKAMEAGCHVLCEKPMAMSVAECDAMIAASEKTGKTMMIAQCLRFWPMYLELKHAVEDKRYGAVRCAYFFRGGGSPKWSYNNWLMQGDKAGGALLDQHIHDVDTLHWLFGMPQYVTSSGVNIIPGSAYDAVSTNYIYPEDIVVNAQDDWAIEGEFGFEMIYRVNFERGSMILRKDGLYAYPGKGQMVRPALEPEDGYYYEMKYFIDCIASGKPVDRCTPQSTRDTIRIAEAEIRSADLKGERVEV